MCDASPGGISLGGEVSGSILVTGSRNLILQAEQLMLLAAKAARQEKRDPSRMLRILAVLAAPVYDPHRPDRPPDPLDLQQEWHGLAEKVRESGAPILLARLVPPTLEWLRRSPSLRTGSTICGGRHLQGAVRCPTGILLRL